MALCDKVMKTLAVTGIVVAVGSPVVFGVGAYLNAPEGEELSSAFLAAGIVYSMFSVPAGILCWFTAATIGVVRDKYFTGKQENNLSSGNSIDAAVN